MSVRTTIEAAHTKIEDNLDYLSTASLTKAKLLIEGIEALLILRAAGQEKGGTTAESLRFDQATLERYLRGVKKWVAVNTPRVNGTVRQRMKCYRD